MVIKLPKASSASVRLPLSVKGVPELSLPLNEQRITDGICVR